MNIQKMIEAFKRMREATIQSHTGHWDKTGQSGVGCPECIKIHRLRVEADALFKEAIDKGGEQ